MLGVRRVRHLGALNKSRTSLGAAVREDVRVPDEIEDNLRASDDVALIFWSSGETPPRGSGGEATKRRLGSQEPAMYLVGLGFAASQITHRSRYWIDQLGAQSLRAGLAEAASGTRREILSQLSARGRTSSRRSLD